MRVVVMGVSGSGKSSIAHSLASRLEATFVDADDLHPQTNIAKMAAGEPLTDADRAPWINRISAELASSPQIVIACSALKRTYRDTIRSFAPEALFLHLDVPREVLFHRLQQRCGHFMPATLLESQLHDLEIPDDAENAIILDGSRSQTELLHDVLAHLRSARMES